MIPRSSRPAPTRSVGTAAAAALALLACAASPGCAGGDAARSGGSGGVASSGDGGEGVLPPGVPVKGNVQVTLRTYNPKDPAVVATMALVNESSEIGRKLKSGRATSTVVRVVSDSDMGALLAAMDEKGFSGTATPGMTLDGLQDDGRRRGVIIVDRNGATQGIDFGLNQGGTAVPTVYTECKRLVWGVHMAVQGFAVSATTGNAEDADRVFQAPPLKMKR